MNLFLKEPHWFDSGTGIPRIRRFGYLDGSQRPAWYQTVTTREKLPGLRLQADDRASTLLLLHNADAIGQWPYHVIARRLFEKHRSTVFVGAHATCKRTRHSEGVSLLQTGGCHGPSLDRFLNWPATEKYSPNSECTQHPRHEFTTTTRRFAFAGIELADLYEERSMLRTAESN